MCRNDEVALRKESVDRNLENPRKMIVSQVALRKESVDRNENFEGIVVTRE